VRQEDPSRAAHIRITDKTEHVGHICGLFSHVGTKVRRVASHERVELAAKAVRI
jgi:hypothetical protein